jgi:hypothetical protein
MVWPDPSERLIDLIFFGFEEDGAGTGATFGGGRDVAGEATEGRGAGGVVAIAAIADPRALGGEALALGEIGAVFGGS